MGRRLEDPHASSLPDLSRSSCGASRRAASCGPSTITGRDGRAEAQPGDLGGRRHLGDRPRRLARRGRGGDAPGRRGARRSHARSRACATRRRCRSSGAASRTGRRRGGRGPTPASSSDDEGSDAGARAGRVRLDRGPARDGARAGRPGDLPARPARRRRRARRSTACSTCCRTCRPGSSRSRTSRSAPVDEVEELERAGVDAVLVGAGDVGSSWATRRPRSEHLGRRSRWARRMTPASRRELLALGGDPRARSRSPHRRRRLWPAVPAAQPGRGQHRPARVADRAPSTALDPGWYDYPSLLMYLVAPVQALARVAVVRRGARRRGRRSASWESPLRGGSAGGPTARAPGLIAAAAVAVATVHVAYSRMAVTDVALTLGITVALALALAGPARVGRRGGRAGGLGKVPRRRRRRCRCSSAGWGQWRRLLAAAAPRRAGLRADEPVRRPPRGRRVGRRLARAAARPRGLARLRARPRHAARVRRPALGGPRPVLARRRRRPRRRAASAAAGPISCSPRSSLAYALYLLPLEAHFDRYVLPLVPVLGVFGGRIRPLRPLAAVLLVVPLVWAVGDARELTRTDTRVRAAAWIEAHVSATALLAADPSTLPLERRRVLRLELPGPGRPVRPETATSAALRAAGVRWLLVSGAVADRVLAARDRLPRRGGASTTRSRARAPAFEAAPRRRRRWQGPGCASTACSLTPGMGVEGRRGIVAIGVAVFLSGAVLLGLEIVASRVLAPYFGSSLFVWGALIGVVLAGLSIGYWLGGALADRFPSPYLLIGGDCRRRGARAPRPARRRLGARADRELGSRARGSIRSSPRSCSSALRASCSGASRRSPCASSRARSSGSDARRDGSSPSRPPAASRARSSRPSGSCPSSAPTRCSPSARSRCSSRRRSSPSAFGCRSRPSPSPPAQPPATAVVVALEPEQGRTLRGAAARNWSPLYRERETRSPSVLDPRSVQGDGFKVRFAKDTRYHRLVVADDESSRYLRFDSSFQSGMYLGQPFRTRFDYTDYLDLGLAYNPDARRVLFIGLGGGSAPKRFWRDFPQPPAAGGRARPGRRRRRVPLVRAAARRSASRSTPRTAGAGSPATTTAGT